MGIGRSRTRLHVQKCECSSYPKNNKEYCGSLWKNYYLSKLLVDVAFSIMSNRACAVAAEQTEMDHILFVDGVVKLHFQLCSLRGVSVLPTFSSVHMYASGCVRVFLFFYLLLWSFAIYIKHAVELRLILLSPACTYFPIVVDINGFFVVHSLEYASCVRYGRLCGANSITCYYMLQNITSFFHYCICRSYRDGYAWAALKAFSIRPIL